MNNAAAWDNSRYRILPEEGFYAPQRLPTGIRAAFRASRDEVTNGASLAKGMLYLALGASAVYYAHTHDLHMPPAIYHQVPVQAQPLISPEPQSPIGPGRSARPLSMGGWPEIIDGTEHPQFGAYHNAAAARRGQARYLQSKSELRRAIASCSSDPSCHANIKAFRDMLDEARQIPDPRTRLEALNGWVNLFVVYDQEEADTARDDSEHRSLVEALRDGMGVCDEQAQLKLFAAESLGFREDDVRLVLEEVSHWKGDREVNVGRHAVVEVRVGSETWVLNNNDVGDLNVQDWTYDRLRGDVIEASSIEKASSHLGYSTQSMFSKEGDGSLRTALPVAAYNSRTRSVYGEIGPQALDEDRHAPSSEISIDGSSFFESNASEPLRTFFNPALAQRFNVTLGR